MSRNAAFDPEAPEAPETPHVPDAADPTSALAAVLAACREGKLGRQLVHSAFLPASPAVYGELDPPLPAEIARALARGGRPPPDGGRGDGVPLKRRT